MNTDRSDTANRWHLFDEGSTIGQRGSEQGTIIRDEEYNDGARITLEQAGLIAPFAITCGIYGWTAHTVFFGDEAVAQHTFEEMKTELERIVEQIPLEGAGSEENLRNIGNEIAAFVHRFP